MSRGYSNSDELSLFGLIAVLLRWRRIIMLATILGVALVLAAAFALPRQYVARSVFLPQDADPSGSTLALAASRFGISVPRPSNSWDAPIYVELLHSQALLEPIAVDTIRIAEKGGRSMPVMDLLGVKGSTPAQRLDRAVSKLRTIVSAAEDKKLGAVKVRVSTRWPSVSLGIAERLLSAINRFNVETRKSQAVAERQYADTQAVAAEAALRAAEDRLQYFLQRNRDIASSVDATFERDRLQRDIDLRQQVYASLVQNREEARLREVRDTPVITVLETPKLPAFPEPRQLALKSILGALFGFLFGVGLALVADTIGKARRAPNDKAREFFEAVEEVTPKFVRRRKSGRTVS
jgi:hypothetical protein